MAQGLCCREEGQVHLEAILWCSAYGAWGPSFCNHAFQLHYAQI